MSLSDLDQYSSDAQFEALLDAQLASLVAGRAFAALPEQYGLSGDAATEAYDLMHLAQRMSESMIALPPSPEFVTRLKNELVGNLTPALILRWRKLPAAYRVAARLGGLTLTAGLALLASRRVLGLLGTLNQARAKADVSLNTVQ
jgi:hypothetical protein